jgi:hypothetical protein
MRTALSILTEKKRMVYGNLAQKIEEGVATEREIAEADNRWVNFWRRSSSWRRWTRCA